MGWGDLCREKRVNIAYIDYQVDDETGEMVKYHVYPVSGYSQISWDWEIWDSFFKQNHIVPNWINCNGIYGLYNEEEGNWTGLVGMVRNSNNLC